MELMRRRSQLYFFEGEKLVRDVLQRRQSVQKLLVLDECRSDFAQSIDQAEEFWVVNAAVMAKVSGLRSPPVCLAVLEGLERTIDFDRHRIVLVLDAIQDPANLGSAFRCAAAFGIDAVAVSGSGVAPSNPKFVRTAQTALLDVPFQRFDHLMDLITAARRREWHVFLTSSQPLKNTVTVDEVTPPCLLVLGNEGRGLDRKLLSQFPAIRLAQSERLDSLNVGVSACILMYELHRRRQS